MLDTSRPKPLRSALFDGAAAAGVRHGFFTREGGLSQGLYGGLNVGLGSADDAATVRENRARVAAALGVAPERLVTLHQVHSPDVVTLTAPPGAARPKADALVTDRPGLALGVLTADCAPVLFADREAGIIGAAHAGWKGALAGVLEATVAAMERLGAARGRLRAVVGPTISQTHYEVGPEFRDAVLADDARAERHFAPAERPGHHRFDLPAYACDRLAAAGVACAALPDCTYADENRFYSYRRATHRGEPDYGRQVSAIVLEER
ncbi:peptidoglycan editing factor PgeF [Aquibium sp. A9E412]|uniref:peptidoglycan editing factor PgeF n=1 Tax=Aquibium sp. A9E412 TaxID=2976767 RepID=UPI0025B1E6AB|nr:peptidoglycan editing factor PgeF [Aquibium sp. A9E412]MDN2567964.1 peptidoglycan editing factor PgeF [Aquibium sp. A9E412]